MSVRSRTRHGQMATLKERRWRLKDIGVALGVKRVTVIYHLSGRCACFPVKAWRSPERVRARHARIVELSEVRPALTLMEIALQLWEDLGNPETGKPLDHSTILHHLENRCRCEGLWAHEK